MWGHMSCKLSTADFDNPNLIPNPKIGPECCCGKIQTHPWFSRVRKGLKKSSFIFLHHPLEYHAEHTLYTLNTCNPKMVIWSFFIFNFIQCILVLTTYLFIFMPYAELQRLICTLKLILCHLNCV